MEKSRQYWEKRQTALEIARQNKAAAFSERAAAAYENAMTKLENAIAARLVYIADDNGVSVTEAMHRLSDDELKGWRMTLDEFKELSLRGDLSDEMELMLKNASHKVHLTHLEAMKTLIDVHMHAEHEQLESNVTDFLGGVWDDTVKKAVADKVIASGVIGFSKESMQTVLTKPWAADGKTFSQRIWQDGQKVSKELQGHLEMNVLMGKNPKDIVKDMHKVMPNNKKADIERLVQTEQAVVASEADKEIWNSLGLEKYEICAVMDYKTSEICRELDGKIFDMKNRKVGVTAPPFHPRCRTVTVPWFDETEDEDFEVSDDEDLKKEFVKKKSKPYTDITSEWKPVDPSRSKIVKNLSEWTHNGNTYKADGKHVVLDYSKHEKEVADLLAKKYGKDVRMVPRVTKPEKVKTPDYLIDGEKWDLKTLKSSGKNTFYNMTKNKKEQAQNFIFDISNLDVSDEWAEKQVSSIFASNNRRWADKIMVLKNDDVKIYKRT